MKAGARECILEEARKSFAQKGFKESTVRDIAGAAGVNVGMISYYFGGKQELYQQCIESSGLKKQGIVRNILKPCSELAAFRARLEIFTEEFLASHAADQYSAQIIGREFENNSGVFKNALEKVFRETFRLIEEYFESARQAGFLRADLDPAEIAVLFHGCLMHQTRIDAIRESWTGKSYRDEKTRKHIATQLIAVFLDGIAEGSSDSFNNR